MSGRRHAAPARFAAPVTRPSRAALRCVRCASCARGVAAAVRSELACLTAVCCRSVVLAAATPPPFPGASGSDERRYTEVSSASLLRAAAARAGPARFRPENGIEEQEGPDDAAPDADTERVGVLLLNLGGPETLSDVQPFLYNLFADPDIIRLPPAVAFLQKPLAGFISKARAPKVRLYPCAAAPAPIHGTACRKHTHRLGRLA